MNQDSVAFIVVCWNNSQLLPEMINSIKKQTYKNIDTFIVDNGSKDNSVEIIKTLMPEAYLTEAESNLGFAKANNLGIKKALEAKNIKYIVLLNTDARLSEDWTEKIIAFASLKPKAAFLQGTTLDYYNHSIIDSTHTFISRNGQATQGSWRDYYDNELGPKKVFGVNAAACMISRAFIDAQPFKNEFLDETMFMYLEDVDATTRAIVMGWDNYLVPGARAYHMGSASSGKNPGFSLYLTFRNNTGMLIKNLPPIIILRLIPRIIKSDIETFRHLRRIDKRKLSWIIPKARIAGMIFVPIFIYKRIKLYSHINTSSEYLWQLMKKGY
jgi:GT2 family glycosyltransferase